MLSIQYTEEDIEWYGLTFDEALKKLKNIEGVQNSPKPLKHLFRKELIYKLMEQKEGISQQTDSEEIEQSRFVCYIITLCD